MTSSGPNGSVVVHVFGRTDVGRTREHNEDAFVVADLTTGNATLQPEVRTHTLGDRGSLFMVADGMGGAAAGEIASAMAIDVVLGELRQGVTEAPTALERESFAASLKRATASANSAIHTYALEHPEYRGMGTTATIAGLLGDTLYLAQVGDSRAYLVRNGVAMQITKDQSLMQKLIEAGEITEEEAEQSERRNIILQALGPESSIKVDLTHQQVRRRDTLVLCSDGLSGQVKIDDIARIATDEPDLMQVCKQLIDRANANGGPDNITVIAVRFDGDGVVAPASGDNVGHQRFALTADSEQTPVAARSTAPLPINTTAETPTIRTTPVQRSTLKVAPIEPAFMLPERPIVSPARKVRGSLIALGLVVVFLVLATWYAYRTTAAIVAPQRGTTAAPPTTP
ncbi:MAG: Stp1/IreP family PP2C-type Ser/Thr phosphatase [Gemmatimonadota bacterium]|nr:Stp1/IreP family PP2C-type Ser/Thr phosphatase [Gemmatimonadota bacterium]